MFRKVQFYQRMLLLVVAWSGLIAVPQAFAAYRTGLTSLKPNQTGLYRKSIDR
jgi:hypothetical protein